MMSHMTSQSYYEQLLIYLCSPEECPRSMLNADKLSMNAHIIIIFSWYTYLGNISRLKKFMVVREMSKSHAHKRALTQKWLQLRNFLEFKNDIKS